MLEYVNTEYTRAYEDVPKTNENEIYMINMYHFEVHLGDSTMNFFRISKIQVFPRNFFNSIKSRIVFFNPDIITNKPE